MFLDVVAVRMAQIVGDSGDLYPRQSLEKGSEGSRTCKRGLFENMHDDIYFSWDLQSMLHRSTQVKQIRTSDEQLTKDLGLRYAISKNWDQSEGP